jgi:hypothetical protein
MTDQVVHISQSDLRELFELDRQVDQELKRLLDLKSYLKALLFAKTPIEEGRFYAHLVFRTIHHPAWKQIVIDELGFDFAESARRKSSTSRLCEVVVEEHGSLPLWKAAMGTGESQV